MKELLRCARYHEKSAKFYRKSASQMFGPKGRNRLNRTARKHERFVAMLRDLAHNLPKGATR